MKFGGSSVATAERIKAVKNIVASYDVETLVIVVSAMGKDRTTGYIGTTDYLISLSDKAQSGNKSFLEDLQYLQNRHEEAAIELLKAQYLAEYQEFLKQKFTNLSNLLNGVYLLKECSYKAMDRIYSYGELCSSKLVSLYLSQELGACPFLDPRDLLKTNDDFGAAKVDFKITYPLIKAACIAGGTFVMGGFVASTPNNITTTLGRGGSDYSAALMAAGIGADALEIWTDVDGVMTADPRRVVDAFSLKQLTYEEAMEMSHFGAKVLHPPTVQPALSHAIPIIIKNTFNPSFSGTVISKETNDEYLVKGVSSIGEIALLTIQGTGLIGVSGIASRLFTTLARERVNIILITQASSEHSISFAVDPKDAAKASKAIEAEFEYELRAHQINPLQIQDDLAVVAIIGSRMKQVTGISGRMFKALGQNGINIYAIAQGSSELNISAVIRRDDIIKGLNALHQAFFLSDTKRINLFVMGVGLIGKTLIQQIEAQSQRLKENLSLDIKLVAATNSRKMLFDANGIDRNGFFDEMMKEGETASLDGFVSRMISMNMANSIFIDNTASDAPPKHYANILKHSISIITPNKIANTESYEQYLNLRELAKNNNARFKYETNVGAGLPIISTLHDLLNSGDQITKIEAVLSGSLSYIFNNFDGSRPFYEVVKEAKEKGLTEPDPRVDLGLKDVARKALILSRDIGRTIELDDIEIKALLPDACMQAADVPAFFDTLVSHNDYFEGLLADAKAKGEVLRILATITPDSTKVSVKTVGMDNPFYALSGSDNMIVFTTSRYNDTPLVVKGPGAGAEVTAAGVFAELITEANELGEG